MKIRNAIDIHNEVNEKLKVFLFNVGQGDHMMLKFPTNEYGIIDFFFNSEICSEPPCLSYFKKLKTEISDDEFKNITIAFFCISHTDKDHIKGVSKTLKWLVENGVFIKNFWFCGARDESDYKDLFDTKIKEVLKKMNIYEQLVYDKQIKKFNNELVNFFSDFKKWKEKKIKSLRYINERDNLGIGEYLFDIKSLMNPCDNSKAVNIGPLYHHILNYNKKMTLDFVYKVIGATHKGNSINKNDISHILNIKFGETNLIFGGDTSKEIWEDCLKEYHNPNNNHLNYFGNIKSNFIKVSHHGSKNSTSKSIWEKIISNIGQVYFGISAGENINYMHPHDETLFDIKSVKEDAIIFSTNFCTTCIKNNSNDEEYHKWYDELDELNNRDYKNKENQNDIEINNIFEKNKISTTNDELGLFAFILEIPNNLKEKIDFKIAYTKRNKTTDCIFKYDEENTVNDNQCKFQSF